jgi:Glycerol-3-phosphate acyltransferase
VTAAAATAMPIPAAPRRRRRTRPTLLGRSAPKTRAAAAPAPAPTRTEILRVAPIVGGIGAAVWIVTFLVFGYASLASILAAASLPVVAALVGEPWPVIAFGALGVVAVVLLHRTNIARLRAGTDNRSDSPRARSHCGSLSVS